MWMIRFKIFGFLVSLDAAGWRWRENPPVAPPAASWSHRCDTHCRPPAWPAPLRCTTATFASCSSSCPVAAPSPGCPSASSPCQVIQSHGSEGEAGAFWQLGLITSWKWSSLFVNFFFSFDFQILTQDFISSIVVSKLPQKLLNLSSYISMVEKAIKSAMFQRWAIDRNLPVIIAWTTSAKVCFFGFQVFR